MAGSGFWIDWRLRVPVEWVRRNLDELIAPRGYAASEVDTPLASADWAAFDLAPRAGGTPFGTLRAQSADEGCQVVIAPGADRSPEGGAALNRSCVALYAALVARGVLDPPAPMARPIEPIAPREA